MRLIAALGCSTAVWLIGQRPRSVTVVFPPFWWVLSFGIGTMTGLSTGIPMIGGVGIGFLPILAVSSRDRIRLRRRRRRTMARWPDFLAQVRARIATGAPLPDAVRAAGRATGGEFRALDRAWGGSFSAGLIELQEEWADPIADRVFTTLRVAVTTGGAHVDDVLSALAKAIADELRLRRSHEAAVAQQQMTAGVALVAPWLILALSLGTNPQAKVEFATQTGHMILMVGAVATGLGYVLARRAARLSEPPRVFG